MEFAEWVVSGLDQLRLGHLPAGNDFYNVVSSGLGGDPRLAAYMNSGEAEAHTELVQMVADAVAANPGFEQRLRTAAEAARPQSAAQGKQPFLSTTNGMLALVAATVVVVGGGIGLAVGLDGSGGNLQSMLKGTWMCNPSAPAGGPTIPSKDVISVAIGDGTFSVTDAGDTVANGTFTQKSSTASLHDTDTPDSYAMISGLPSGAGSFDVTVGAAGDTSKQIHLSGTLSDHKIKVVLPEEDAEAGVASFSCTK